MIIMPAFVPKFKHDIFVSYVHVDNRKFDGETGWVETLVDDLREALPQKLKRGKPDIWRDQRLSQSKPFPDALHEAVTQSATLLIILSESYLTSDWCSKELQFFLQATKGKAQGRIFLVRLDTLEYKQWPDAFEGILGIKFFEQANTDAPFYTLGTPAATDQNKNQYFQRLDDLSRELGKKLLVLKNQATDTDNINDKTSDQSPAIFLSEVTPDLDEIRDNIRRHLQQTNIRVLPETIYDRDPQKYQNATESDLDQCTLFVQLLGQYVSPKAPGLINGYEGLQLDVAEQKQMPILRWHSPDLDIASIKDKQLLQRSEVMVTGLEEFKVEIIKQIKKAQAVDKLPSLNGESFVLVNACKNDDSVIMAIEQEFDKIGIDYEIINEDEDFKTLLEEFDGNGLMVVYGKCERNWAKQQVRLCRQLLLKKKQQAPVCAVYIGPPDEKPALGIRLQQIPLLGYQDNPMTTFVSALQKKMDSP